MADQQNVSAPTEERSGIFEPKPPMKPIGIKSGKRKAAELIVVVLIIAAVCGIIGFVKTRYRKPINTYYKGLSQMSADKMAEAFPAWLVHAKLSDDSMSIYNMCETVISTAKMQLGEGVKAKAEISDVEEKDEAYLQQLETGIQDKYGQKVDITKGRWLTLNVTYTVGKKKTELTEYVRVYKINGRWVLLDLPSGEK